MQVYKPLTPSNNFQVIELPFDYSNYGHMVLSTSDSKLVIDFKDLIYLNSDSNYTQVVLNNEKVLISKTLKWIAEKLDKRFLRVHNSFIVNLLQIKSYSMTKNHLVLKNGEVIPVSRAKRKALDQVLK